MDVQIRKIFTSSKIDLKFNAKIDFRDITERYINDTQNKCESILNHLPAGRTQNHV